MTPNTNLKLCAVPVNITQKNQLSFSSAGSQAGYFSGCAVYSFSDFTYQRKDSFVRVPANAENLWNCNYCMYQNSNFGNKWFYAFVIKIEYVNENCSNVYIETDPFQTWLFDMVLNPSFVVRETVKDDTIFKNTIPENIPTGELKCIDEDIATGLSLGAGSAGEFDANYYVCIVMSEFVNWLSASISTTDSFFGGVANCAYFFGTSLANAFPLIDKINENGQAGAIVACFPVPKSFVTFCDLGDGFGLLSDHNAGRGWELSVNSNQSTLDGYIPKNNKLFCYPYNYLQLDNGAGANTILKYELFANPDNITLSTFKVPGVQSALVTFPINYNGMTRNMDFAVTFSNFPQIAWNTDTFKNWLGQNAVSQIVNSTVKMGNIAVAGATGNIAGAVGGGISAISDIANLYSQSQQPLQMHGTPSSNAQLYTNTGNVYYRKFCLRSEYAQMIDNYFSRYGYLVNVIKKPSFNNRPNWDFVKTDNINISGNIPNSDIKIIADMFNSGLTVWHNPATFGDYNVNNKP